MSEEKVLDPTLLSLLACPEDKGALHLVQTGEGVHVLYNPRLRRVYPIDSGIPVLLADEARDVDDTEHEQLSAQVVES